MDSTSDRIHLSIMELPVINGLVGSDGQDSGRFIAYPEIDFCCHPFNGQAAQEEIDWATVNKTACPPNTMIHRPMRVSWQCELKDYGNSRLFQAFRPLVVSLDKPTLV